MRRGDKAGCHGGGGIKCNDKWESQANEGNTPRSWAGIWKIKMGRRWKNGKTRCGERGESLKTDPTLTTERHSTRILNGKKTARAQEILDDMKLLQRWEVR